MYEFTLNPIEGRGKEVNSILRNYKEVLNKFYFYRKLYLITLAFVIFLFSFHFLFSYLVVILSSLEPIFLQTPLQFLLILIFIAIIGTLIYTLVVFPLCSSLVGLPLLNPPKIEFNKEGIWINNSPVDKSKEAILELKLFYDFPHLIVEKESVGFKGTLKIKTLNRVEEVPFSFFLALLLSSRGIK